MAAIKLPRDMVNQLKQSQRQLHDFVLEVDKAESCGIDCQRERQMHEEASAAIEALLTNYGGGGGE